MQRCIIGVCGSLLLISFLAGCSSSSSVKPGDRFVIIEELRESATIQAEGPYSEGVEILVPAGAVIEAMYAPSAKYFDVKVVELDGNKNPAYINARLVREGLLNLPGFEGFYFSIPVEYIGAKIKKSGA